MIFDSPEIASLKTKNERIPKFYWPGILQLAAEEELQGDRKLLEELIQSVPSKKQKDWLGRLVNEKWDQHISAWFEMMLFSWLQNVGQVQVEPEIEGEFPDFSVNIEGKSYIIEARAWLIDPKERREQQILNEIISMIHDIQLPFIILIERYDVHQPINLTKLRNGIVSWLESQPENDFDFYEDPGNHILLKWEKTITAKTEHILTLGPTEGYWVNPDLLKSPLKKKSNQHQNIRKAGYPYIIAIFLESAIFSAEEVVEAWFGRESVTIDTSTRKIISQGIDMKGLHFKKGEIFHKSVSGTLVFRYGGTGKNGTRILNAWYIQNPYAHVPVRPSIFPIDSIFEVLKKENGFYKMGWKTKR